MSLPQQRMTRQRSVILETLVHMRCHPTADELYDRVRQQLPNVSLGTIYRNLDLLTRAGRVRRLEIAGIQARFDAELEPHHHVRCTRCGRVDDVAIADETEVHSPARSRQGFSITGFRIEYDGICPDCRKGNVAAPTHIREGNSTP